MSKDNGGSAFPYGIKEIRVDTCSGGTTEVSDEFDSGMTLRDYFAGCAMTQGMAILVGLGNRLNDHQLNTLAETAYKAADAMLNERNK